MTWSLSSLIPYMPKTTQQELAFFIHLPTSIPAVTNTVTAVQRHWLCSTFSIKSSPVEQGSAVLMENQIINFLSWNPTILQACKYTVVLRLPCPQWPLPTCSIAIQPCQICTHSACSHFSQQRQGVCQIYPPLIQIADCTVLTVNETKVSH